MTFYKCFRWGRLIVSTSEQWLWGLYLDYGVEIELGWITIMWREEQ